MRRYSRINLNSNHHLPSRPPEPASALPDTAPPLDPEAHLQTALNRMDAKFQQAHSLAEGGASGGSRGVGEVVVHHEPPRRSNPSSSAQKEPASSFVQGSSTQVPRTQPPLPPLSIPDPSQTLRRSSVPQPTINSQTTSRSSSSALGDTRQPAHSTQPHLQSQQHRAPGLYMQYSHSLAQSSPIIHNQSHPSTPQAQFSSPVPQYSSPSQQYPPMPQISPRVQVQMLPPSQPSPTQPNALAFISERLDFIVDSLEANRAQQSTVSHRINSYERNFGAIDMKLEKQQEAMDNIIASVKTILAEQEAPNAQRFAALEKTLATSVETVNNLSDTLDAFVNSMKSSKDAAVEKEPGRKAVQENRIIQFMTLLTQRVGEIGHSLSGIQYAVGIDNSGNHTAQQKGKQRAFGTIHEYRAKSAIPERLLSGPGSSAGTVIDVDALDDDIDVRSRSPMTMDRSGLHGWVPSRSSAKRPPGMDSRGRSILERLEATESMLMDIAELLEKMRDPQANVSSHVDLAADQETSAPLAGSQEDINRDVELVDPSTSSRQLSSSPSSSASAQTFCQDQPPKQIPTASESDGPRISETDLSSALSSPRQNNEQILSSDAASEGGSQAPVGLDTSITSMVVDSAGYKGEDSEVRIHASGDLDVKLLEIYTALIEAGAMGGMSQFGSDNSKTVQIQIELPVPTKGDVQLAADAESSLANRSQNPAILELSLRPYPKSSTLHLNLGNNNTTRGGKGGEGRGAQIHEDFMAVDDMTANSSKVVSETYMTAFNGKGNHQPTPIASSMTDCEPHVVGMTTLEEIMACSQHITSSIFPKSSMPSRIPVATSAKLPKQQKVKTSPRTPGTTQSDISSSRSVAKTRSTSFLEPSDATTSPDKASTPVKCSSSSVSFGLSPADWMHTSSLPFDLAELPECDTPTSSKRTLRSQSQKVLSTPSAPSSSDSIRVTRSKIVSLKSEPSPGSNTAGVKTPVPSKVREVETAERAMSGLLTAQKHSPHKSFTLASLVHPIQADDPTMPAASEVAITEDTSTDTQKAKDINSEQNTTSEASCNIETTVTAVQNTKVDQSDLISPPSQLPISNEASELYALNRSYRLPSQPEGSVALLRQELLGNPFLHAGVGVTRSRVEPADSAEGNKEADHNMNCDVPIKEDPVDEDMLGTDKPIVQECMDTQGRDQSHTAGTIQHVASIPSVSVEGMSESGEMRATTPVIAFRESSYMSALTPLAESEALVSINASRAASVDHVQLEPFSSVLSHQSIDQGPTLLEEERNERDNVAPENLICDDTSMEQPLEASIEEEQMSTLSPVTRTSEVDAQTELRAAPLLSSQTSGTTVDEDTVQDLVLESIATSPIRNSHATMVQKEGSTSALSSPQQKYAPITPSDSPEGIYATVSIGQDRSIEVRGVHGLPTPDSMGMRQSPRAQADAEGMSLEINETPQPGSPHIEEDILDAPNLIHVKQELDNSLVDHSTAACAQDPAIPLRNQITQSPKRTTEQTYIYISDTNETPQKELTKSTKTQKRAKKKRSPSVISISSDDVDTSSKKRMAVRTVEENTIPIFSDDEKGVSSKKSAAVGPVGERKSVPVAETSAASASATTQGPDVEVEAVEVESFDNPAYTSTPLRSRTPAESGSAVDGQQRGVVPKGAVAESNGRSNLLTRSLSPMSDLSQPPSPAPKVRVQTPPQPARTPALPEPSSAVKKYIARLDAEDDVPIIPAKRRKVSEATESTRADNIAGPSNSLTQKAAPPKKSLLVLQKKGKSAAVTKVKKRKAPADGVDENEDQPPLKKANIRKSSSKGIEEKVEVEDKKRKELETIRVKDKGKLREQPDRSPIKQAKTEPMTPARGHLSRSVNVKWPTIDKPNFDQFIQCNSCDGWYHIGCVGVAPNDPRLDDSEDYSCPPCNAGSTVQASESPVKGEHSSYPQGSTCSRPKCHRRQKNKKKKPEPQTFVVEAFLGRYRKMIGGQGLTTFYLVKWHGYPLNECTWEELNGMGLANSASLITTFEEAAEEQGIDLEASVDEGQLLREAIDAGWSKNPF